MTEKITNANLNQKLIDLDKKIDAVEKIIYFGNECIMVRLAVGEDSAKTNRERISELEKHHTQAKIEATKAAWHLTITLIIAATGWIVAIITRITNHEFLDKLGKLFE